MREFEDVLLTKMIYTLVINDDIEKSYVIIIDDVDYRLERTQSLRSNIFLLLSFKQLFDTKISPPQEK